MIARLGSFAAWATVYAAPPLLGAVYYFAAGGR